MDVQKEIFEQTIFDMNPLNAGKKRKEIPYRYELKYPELLEVKNPFFVFPFLYFDLLFTTERINYE
jgi:hypothetical protein